MKITTKIPKTIIEDTFHTGVKSKIDRKIGSINILSISQIMDEKNKLNNMRNGKVRE